MGNIIPCKANKSDSHHLPKCKHVGNECKTINMSENKINTLHTNGCHVMSMAIPIISKPSQETTLPPQKVYRDR